MTSRRICEWAGAGVLACGLALTGCGSGDQATKSASGTTGTSAQAATPEPSAALPAVLRGKWKRTMTPRDWRTAGRGYPVGTWRLDTDERGAVDVYFPRKSTVDFSTQFDVKGRQLEIETIPVCPGQTGRYTWRATAKAFTLTPVGATPCKQGAALFGGTWTRRR